MIIFWWDDLNVLLYFVEARKLKVFLFSVILNACKIFFWKKQKTDEKPWLTELTKPVCEIANYVKVNEDIKNGHHLADILTRACFASGNNCIYEEFQSLIQVMLQEDVASYLGRLSCS